MSLLCGAVFSVLVPADLTDFAWGSADMAVEQGVSVGAAEDRKHKFCGEKNLWLGRGAGTCTLRSSTAPSQFPPDRVPYWALGRRMLSQIQGQLVLD